MTMHPADPIYLGFQLLQLRFQIQNDREPTDEEDLTLLRQSAGCTTEEAEELMVSVRRMRELEVIAHEVAGDMMSTMFGGALSHLVPRR